MASLYEAMKMGMATLQWSADITYPEDNQDSMWSKSFRFFNYSIFYFTCNFYVHGSTNVAHNKVISY